MSKTLYCIRHGLALHNVTFWEIGSKAYSEYKDTRLLEMGVEQAKNLGETWKILMILNCYCISMFKNSSTTYILK